MKEYPYWWVTVQKWNAERKEYEYCHIGDYKTYEEAKETFEEIEKNLSADLNHAELFEELEGKTIRIAYKDLWGDGEVETIWERKEKI